MRFVYKIFGPSPRTCYNLAGDWHAIGQLHTEISHFLLANSGQALSCVMTTSKPADISRVFRLVPSEDRTHGRLDAASPYIARLMVEKWAGSRHDQQREMRRVFPRKSILRYGDGRLFELFAHFTLSQSYRLPLRRLTISNKDGRCEYDSEVITIGGSKTLYLDRRTPKSIDIKKPFPSTGPSLSSSEYYISKIENQSAYNSFVYGWYNKHITLFHITIEDTHDLSKTGLAQLESARVSETLTSPFDFILVVRPGHKIKGTIPVEWSDKLALYIGELDDESYLK